MHAAGLSNNHGTRHELSMPSTIIAVETLPHLRRAEFEGRPLPGAASAGVESQTGVLRPSVAESRGHAWTPGGGPRVGEQLGGGRRHGYAQAHGRESVAGVDCSHLSRLNFGQAPGTRMSATSVTLKPCSALPAQLMQGRAEPIPSAVTRPTSTSGLLARTGTTVGSFSRPLSAKGSMKTFRAAVLNEVGMKWFMPESREERSTGRSGMAESKYERPGRKAA